MKILKKTLLVVALLFMMVSCVKEFKSFDPALFHGKWVNGTEYWRYDTDSTGVTWDEGEDVHESEAQPFKWEYNNFDNSLTHIHWMEMTQDWTVPRVYTVTELNDSILQYTDKFGKSYSFSKIN